MLFSIISFFLSFLVDLLVTRKKSIREKDLAIALLRQQLRIIARRQTRGPRIPRWQKLPLSCLGESLKGYTSRRCLAIQTAIQTRNLAALAARVSPKEMDL